jgi:hypothetical protein
VIDSSAGRSGRELSSVDPDHSPGLALYSLRTHRTYYRAAVGKLAQNLAADMHP